MKITPGEILLEEYLQPMNIMSIRFGTFFGQSEDFWHGIQVECDFRALQEGKAKLTSTIQTAEELVAQ